MDKDQFVPRQAYFLLPELPALKRLSYKSLLTKKWLQPNGGKPDCVINGRNAFSRASVIKWLDQDDASLLKASQEVRS